MAKYAFKYDFNSDHIYKNKGVLKDAYDFNLIDGNEPVRMKSARKSGVTFNSIIYRMLSLIIFINYFLMYSIVWLVRKLVSQMGVIFNQFVVYMVRISLRENRQQ